MKKKKVLSYVLFMSMVFLLAVVGLGDSYALNGMGGAYMLEGLVPDYGVDCSLVPSFALLSQNNISNWYLDLPGYFNNNSQVSAQSTPQGNLDFGANPQLIFHSGNLLIDVNGYFDRRTIRGKMWGWSNGTYQDLWIYLNPTFEINNKVAIGLGGAFENYNYSGEHNGSFNNFYANLNGALRLGAWILGAKIESNIYDGNSFKLLRNASISVIGNGNVGHGNGIRFYGTYSPGEWFNGNIGISYYNQNAENISGIYSFGHFNGYNSKFTYYDVYAGPFLQRKIGKIIFRGGLDANVWGNIEPNSNPSFSMNTSFGIGYKIGSGIINLSSLWMWYNSANNNNYNLKLSYESTF